MRCTSLIIDQFETYMSRRCFKSTKACYYYPLWIRNSPTL